MRGAGRTNRGLYIYPKAEGWHEPRGLAHVHRGVGAIPYDRSALDHSLGWKRVSRVRWGRTRPL